MEKDYAKKYYQSHKENIIDSSKKWRKNNPDWVKEYYQKNKDRIDKSSAKWREKNSKRFTELCSQSRKRRVERLKAEGCLNPWAVVSKGAIPKYASSHNKESE